MKLITRKSKRHVTKSEILEYLYESKGADAFEVAVHMGFDYPAAAMALLRLSRQGLVERLVDPERGIYWYRLSPRGRARLKYFHS